MFFGFFDLNFSTILAKTLWKYRATSLQIKQILIPGKPSIRVGWLAAEQLKT